MHYYLEIKNLLLFASLSLLAACGNPPAADVGATLAVAPLAVAPPPKTPVEITTVVFRDIRQEERFAATAFYPETNKVASPIAGFILRSPQQAGETVGKGQVLFTLETKEHRAINADPDLKKSDLSSMGVITVHAPASGALLTLDQRQGEYVAEGATLCTIASSDKVGFRLSVPYEFNAFVKPGTNCTIELPDKTRLPGRVAENLTTTAITSQTQVFLVKPLKPVAVPEGLNVAILIQTEQSKRAAVLPKSAILSNETLDEFWVMQLLDDSTAVKVPVTLGLTTGDAVQVTSPRFSAEDRILTEGNYGLADTALVQVRGR